MLELQLLKVRADLEQVVSYSISHESFMVHMNGLAEPALTPTSRISYDFVAHPKPLLHIVWPKQTGSTQPNPPFYMFSQSCDPNEPGQVNLARKLKIIFWI